MYKIVFIDDNQAIIEGLNYIIDWEKLNIDICGAAYDGKMGMKLIKKIKPEIVIVDIEMPGINGLKMIRKIIKEQPDLKIIILSGYDNFNYAQEAIEMGVKSYILKPIRKKILLNKLKEITLELKAEAAKISKQKSLLSQINLVSNIAREKYFFNLISNQVAVESKEEINYSLLGINSWPDNYCLMMIEFDQQDTSIINKVLRKNLNIPEENYIIIPLLEKQLMFFLHAESEPKLMTLREKIILDLKKNIKISYYLGVSLIHNDFKKLNQSLQEAREALKDVCENQGVKFYKNLNTQNNKNKINTQKFIKQIINKIKAVELESALESLDDLFIYLKENSCRTVNIYTECIKLFFEIKKLISNYQINHHLKDDSSYLSIIYLQSKFRTLSALQTEIETIIETIINKIKDAPVTMAEIMVNEIKDYLKDNYIDASRESIAKNFNITPTYLSKIFKNITGINLIDYLTKLKMDAAKIKLLNTSDQIQEIAEEMGYANAYYFTKVFKKNIGMTPSKFRRHKSN